jgi:formate hydrogenlyase transcriptional activator
MRSEENISSRPSVRPKPPNSGDRAKLLLEINNALVSNLDLRDLVTSIGECLQQFIRYDAAVLYLYDPDTNSLREHSLDTDSEREIFGKGLVLPIEGSASGKAFTTRRMVITNSRDLESLAPEVKELIRAANINSTCSLPLFMGDEILGVMTFLSAADNNFSNLSAELLEQIATQITIAVTNALSFKKLQREKDRFGMLMEASNALSSVLDLSEVLKTASDILCQHVHHDFAGVALHDRGSDTLRIMALENPPDNFLDGAATIPVDDTPDEFPSPHMRQVREIGINSFCCVPLISRNQAIGVLAVASLKEHAFDGEDGETIQLIANQLAGAVEAAVQYNEIERLKNQLTGEKLYLEEEIQSEYNFEEIVGSSAALKYVLRQIETVAPTDSCVLLYGETGTGKELISRAIHNLSERRERTLVKLNCAAIPTGLLESELFGHEKGAFTGAVASRVGRFELANRGTLLLDEIGDIPLELQPKLLRVLQESEFERLGSSRTIKTDVRLIAATNANLPELVEEKKFRSDLYYRLNVFPISIPPLRERREDIPLLTGYFTKKHALRMCKKIEVIPRESIDALCAYDFPGNIRELENFIERAVILSRGKELELPLAELNHKPRTHTDDGVPLMSSIQDVERAHIAEVLKKTNGMIGGKGGAAELLNLPVSTLRHRMKKLGLK